MTCSALPTERSSAGSQGREEAPRSSTGRPDTLKWSLSRAEITFNKVFYRVRKLLKLIISHLQVHFGTDAALGKRKKNIFLYTSLVVGYTIPRRGSCRFCTDPQSFPPKISAKLLSIYLKMVLKKNENISRWTFTSLNYGMSLPPAPAPAPFLDAR